MTKLFKHIAFLLLLVSLSVLWSQDAHAFFIKFDMGKASSKVTNAIQSIKTKAEEILDGIQNSQFGKFVGKGIEKAKEAKGFLASSTKAIQDTYGKAEELIQTSEAGQIAILASQIAKLNTQKAMLNKQKTEEINNINDQIKIINIEAEGKIQELQNNISILETKGDAEAVAKSQAQIVDIENKRDADIAEQQNKLKELEEEYNSKFAEIDAEIAELTAQSAELAKSKLGGEEDRTTEEAIKETVEAYTADTHMVSIKEEMEIKKARSLQMQMGSVVTFASMAKLADKMVVSKDNIDTNADVAETSPGESEASNALGETLANQINVMRDILVVLIEDMKTQTAIDVNSFKGVAIKEISGNFNLCDYAFEEKTEDSGEPSSPEGNDNTPSSSGSGGDNNSEGDDLTDWII